MLLFPCAETSDVEAASKEAKYRVGLAAYNANAAVREYGEQLHTSLVVWETETHCEMDKDLLCPSVKMRNTKAYSLFTMAYTEGTNKESFEEDGKPSYQFNTWVEWKYM